MNPIRMNPIRMNPRMNPIHVPTKNGLIALWSATNRWYVVKYVSQKRNWSKNKNQWYNILVTFIFKFSQGLY